MSKNMWFEDGFDEETKSLIQSKQFADASLKCQDESFRWAKVLIENLGLDALELHEGMFLPDGDPTLGEGHSWLEVDGYIFDPTASQFGFDMDSSFYELHEYKSGDSLVRFLSEYGIHIKVPPEPERSNQSQP